MHVFPLCGCFYMTCLEMSHRGASCCFHIAFRNIQALSVNLRKKKFKTSCKIENVIMCCADRAGHFSSPPLQGPQIQKEPLPCFIRGVTLGSEECFELDCQWSVQWTVFNPWTIKTEIFLLIKWKNKWIMTFTGFVFAI